MARTLFARRSDLRRIFRWWVSVVCLLVFLGEGRAGTKPASGSEPGRANPVLPGYFADPSIVKSDGKAYIYATLDPWGGETLGCWESSDFKNWTYRALNWPTKPACMTPQAATTMVWAPAVVKGPDGRFYMYVSVGSEIWAGVADHPLGPWKDLLDGRPLIPRNFRPGYHMIDPDVFTDDDGQSYLYWGSGLSWETMESTCWIVKLAPDMKTLVGEVQGVKLPHYLEGPVMLKRHGKYFLMYSWGNTTKDTYQVHYAVGDSPLGPFKEAAAPILKTDSALNVVSPGHHTVFQHQGTDYILYHRHSIPFDRLGRQICIDPLEISADGTIKIITPSHDAPPFAQGRAEGHRELMERAVTTASGHIEHASPEYAFDNNYATRWKGDSANAWLQVDLGKAVQVSRHILRPEYAWKPYSFRLESSLDGNEWKVVEDYTGHPVKGSPIEIDTPVLARFFRLSFTEGSGVAEPSILEWNLR